MMGLNHPDGVFVERRTPHFHAGRGPEPIEDPRSGPAPAPFRVDDVRILVPALVAVKPKIRQAYFPFPRVAVFFTDFLVAGFGGFFAVFIATGFFAAGAFDAAFLRAGSGVVARCTSVKRV